MTMLAVVNPVLVLFMHQRIKTMAMTYFFPDKDTYTVQLV